MLCALLEGRRRLGQHFHPHQSIYKINLLRRGQAMKFQQVLQPRRAPGFKKSHLTGGDRQSGLVLMAGPHVKLNRTAALNKKTAAATLSLCINVPEPAERPGVVCLHPLTFALWVLFTHYDFILPKSLSKAF